MIGANQRTEVKAFVKYRGDMRVQEFYHKYLYGERVRTSRVFVQKVINEHMDELNSDYSKSKWSKRKIPSFYRFEIRKYIDGKLVKFKNKAYIEKGLQWERLSFQTKNFK